MKCLRSLFWLSASYNFRFVAKHVPGKENALADCISRLHDPFNVKFLLSNLSSRLQWGDIPHMSQRSFLSFFMQA